MANERFTFTLACTTCKNRNYYFARGRRRDYKVEAKKFCRSCNKRTPHKESKL